MSEDEDRLRGCKEHVYFTNGCEPCQQAVREFLKSATIKFAPMEEIDKYQEELGRLFETMDYEVAFVTDWSTMGMFFDSESEEGRKERDDMMMFLTETLGFRVEAEDKVWEVAKRIRESVK